MKVRIIKKNSSMGFEIAQEHIDMVNKAEEYLKIIDDFKDWVSNNFHGTNVEQGYRIMEDIVKSNEHIIKKIKKFNK